MTLKFNSQLNDTISDIVGKILLKLDTMPRWTNAKYIIYDQLLNQMAIEGYKCFSGDYRTYHIQRKGQHCLYMVPPDHKGALAEFSGLKVRVVCDGSWDQYSGRIFYAKQIVD